MENRRLPHLVATQMTREEKAATEYVARASGVTVTELLREIVIPEVTIRSAQLAERMSSPQGAP